jgi:cohesin complex subunit SCC1
MLLTDLILAKKGPLAKVWISAHHERKLTKAQALQVDVGETVGAYFGICFSRSTKQSSLKSKLVTLRRGHLGSRSRTDRAQDVRSAYAWCRSYLLEEGSVPVRRLQGSEGENRHGKSEPGSSVPCLRTLPNPKESVVFVQAFRPGAVDLPEDQLRASKAAITLPDRNQDFELMLSDLDW